jgi:hypothetical protein
MELKSRKDGGREREREELGERGGTRGGKKIRLENE